MEYNSAYLQTPQESSSPLQSDSLHISTEQNPVISSSNEDNFTPPQSAAVSNSTEYTDHASQTMANAPLPSLNTVLGLLSLSRQPVIREPKPEPSSMMNSHLPSPGRVSSDIIAPAMILAGHSLKSSSPAPTLSSLQCRQKARPYPSFNIPTPQRTPSPHLNNPEPVTSHFQSHHHGFVQPTSSKPLTTIQAQTRIQVVDKKHKFKCTYPNCLKGFPSRAHLTRHYRIHTGEKPFKCLSANCDRYFSRQDNMLQHYRSHSG
jgi:uncharacterized Zn-finger protein